MMRSFKPPKQEFLFLSNQFIWLHLLLEVIKKETGQFRSVYQREYLYELDSIRFCQHLDNVHMNALQCCQVSLQMSLQEMKQSQSWNSSICHSDKKTKLIILNHEGTFFYKLHLLTASQTESRMLLIIENCLSIQSKINYWPLKS